MGKDRNNCLTYPQDFYTGAQVRVYFGSIWVDDLATIQYQTSHNKVPLYGYADHQFRSVAKGQFLVKGNFTVAFKENGYLYSVLQMAKQDKSGLQTVFRDQQSFDTYLQFIGQGYTIEQALDFTSKHGKSRQYGGGTDQSDFEDIAEVLEDSIWGKASTPKEMANRIPRSDELDYNKYTISLDAVGRHNFPTDIDRDGFDILLTFGNYRSGNDNAEHTMISVNDVHITGESLIASPAAEPIGMSYEFFARGLNEKVSGAWPIRDQKIAGGNTQEPSAIDKQNTQTEEQQKRMNDIAQLAQQAVTILTKAE